MFVSRFIPIFCLISILIGYNACAQLKVSGRVFDEDCSPLAGVMIVVRGSVIGTKTEADGLFNLDIPWDSAFLSFDYLGYPIQIMKVTVSGVLEVKMDEGGLGAEFPLSKRSDKPLKVRKERGRTIGTYSIDTFPLVNISQDTKRVAWVTHGYTVYLPYKALIKSLDDSHVDRSKELSFLRSENATDTIFLPHDFLQGYVILNNLAVDMIKKKSISITKGNRRIGSIEIRQVFGLYNKKSGFKRSGWSGLEFWVKGGKGPLFDSVHNIIN